MLKRVIYATMFSMLMNYSYVAAAWVAAPAPPSNNQHVSAQQPIEVALAVAVAVNQVTNKIYLWSTAPTASR